MSTSDGSFRSERHARMSAEYPTEIDPWQKPVVYRAERPAFGGCVCALGLENCTCAPATEPAVYTGSIYDAEGRRQLRWLKGVIGLVVAGIVGALLAGVFL